MMRCHSPDVSSCPIVLAVQDNVNVHDDVVGWGLCHYRSLAKGLGQGLMIPEEQSHPGSQICWAKRGGGGGG